MQSRFLAGAGFAGLAWALLATSAAVACTGSSTRPSTPTSSATDELRTVSTYPATSASNRTPTPEDTHAPGETFVNGALRTSIAQTSVVQTASPTATATPGDIFRTDAQPHGLIAMSGDTTFAVDVATGEVHDLLTAHLGEMAYFAKYTYFPSPDGTRIAFACNAVGLPRENDFSHLCIVSGSGHAPAPIVAPADLVTRGAVAPRAWSPDGSKLLFRVTPTQSSATDSADTYIFDVATSQRKRLVRGLGSGLPIWSPDGTRYLARTSVGLYVVDAATGDMLNLRSALPNSTNNTPVHEAAWSPDGNAVAVSLGDTGHYVWDLYTIAADGSAARYIGLGGIGITWSPDGQWIARSVDIHGLTHPPACSSQCYLLYAVRSDGSEDRALTDGFSNAVDTAWAPDSTHIAFRGQTPDTVQRRLYLTSIDDPAPVLLSGEEYVGAPDAGITWSRGGHAIFYLAYPVDSASFQCGQGGCNDGYLYTTDAAGSRASRQLYPERISRIVGVVP